MAIFNFTFGKKKKQREQEEAMMDWYQELQNIQAFQGNVLGPAMQGTGVLPGIDSISAGLDSGGVPIDPNSPGVQDMMRWGRSLPVPPALLADNPIYSQLAVSLYDQAMGNDPAILEQERRQEIQKEILARTGKKVDQNLLGLDELEPTFRDPSLLPRERILQNLGEKEEAAARGKLNVSGPEWDRQQAQKVSDRIRVKGIKGGGGGKEKKPKELSRSNIKNIRAMMFDYNPKLIDEQTEKPTKDGMWIQTRAQHYMSKERLGEVSAVERAIQDFNERRSQRIQEQQSKDRETGRLGISSPVTGTETPVAPANPTSAPTAPERAAQVSQGAIIRAAQADVSSGNKTVEQARIFLEGKGIDPDTVPTLRR